MHRGPQRISSLCESLCRLCASVVKSLALRSTKIKSQPAVLKIPSFADAGDFETIAEATEDAMTAVLG